MEGDQTRIFREKLSQWISSQGFWFQLRHSVQGGGGWSMAVYHLLRIGVRCLVVLLVIAAGFAIYMVRHSSSESFREKIEAKLTESLGATEARIQDFKRSGGEVQIRMFAAEGTPKTFFNRMDGSLVRFGASWLDGIAGGWNPGVIRMRRFDARIKSGADSPEDAVAIMESVLGEYPGFSFSALEVEEAGLVWGFNALERQGRGFSTQGRIDSSQLKAVRGDAGWSLEFTGGTFSQNWLQKLAINRIEATLDRAGLKISKATFSVNGGTVELSDVTVSSGEKPEVSGKLKLSRVDLHSILPEGASDFMEGTISGEFRLSGSTNTSEGLVMEGDVRMDGRDFICIRERLPLLNTLGVIDSYHSYKKVVFNEGSFHLRSSAQQVSISSVNLKAGDLAILKGNLLVRQPTEKELQQAGPQFTGMAGAFEAMGGAGSGNADEITLGRAGSVANERQGFAKISEDSSMFDRHNADRINERASLDVVARQSRTLRYEGSFQLFLPPDALERTTEKVRERFPLDKDLNMVAIGVPVNGLLEDISIELSESILKDGTKR